MSSNILSFRDLKIWQLGLKITKQVYSLTKTLPKEETFGLSSQMRRSAVSVPSNIAEGRARSTRKDFCQFLYIALGSLSELETQLIITQEFYKNKEADNIIELIHEEQRMVSSMIKKLRAATT